MEKLRYKIDWTSLWLEGNWCVNVLFLLCFILYLGAISKYNSQGSYIWRGVLEEGFLCHKFEGLIVIHEGAYFRNITVLPNYFVETKNHLKGLPRESCEVVVKELIKITQDPISSLTKHIESIVSQAPEKDRYTTFISLQKEYHSSPEKNNNLKRFLK